MRLSDAIAAASHPGSWKAWRAVEAQHIVSTLRLTDNDPFKQDLLERILDETKPPMPVAAHGLHYLLATPFRYPPSGHGSRFRAFPDPGVIYGAAERRTACAELGFWRWRFAQQSEGLSEIPATAQTVFRFGAEGAGIDLRIPPLNVWGALWTDRNNYTETQALGREARRLGVQCIEYRSVRDPGEGVCYAVLAPDALRPRQPLEQQTWYLTVAPQGAIWQRERERFVFTF